MTDVLKTIVRRKRKEVAAAKIAVPLEELRERISELGRTRNFFQAVFDHGNTSRTRLIAEVKRKSPSAGVIREDFDPVAIARQYHAGGATAISCLTDSEDFGGKLEYIHAIRDAIPLPVLRKDFIIDTYQIWESRAAGADAVLLIAECLRESEIIDFQILCVELGMTILLEVHDAENLCRVLNLRIIICIDHLTTRHFFEWTIDCDEFCEISRLNDPTRFHHINFVDHSNRAQSMRDNDAGGF